MSTITVPDLLPSPEEDAEKLHKASNGWPTHENDIIQILAHRTAAQRSAIAAAYTQLYNETLLNILQTKLSGHLEKAVTSWVEDTAERDAKLVNHALEKKDEIRQVWVFIEVSCASSPHHLLAVRKAYHALYSSSIEEDVAYHYAGSEPLVQFLVRLLSSYRYDHGENYNAELAKVEAAKLHDAFVNKQPQSEQVIRILSTRSKPQLKATFKSYEEDFGKPIDQDIQEIGSSQFLSMLKAAVWCLGSPEKHFVEVVKTAVHGLGTDDSLLIRAIVSRAEIDMENIKEEYKNRYNTTLYYDVKHDTSWSYKDFLLSLVGHE